MKEHVSQRHHEHPRSTSIRSILTNIISTYAFYFHYPGYAVLSIAPSTSAYSTGDGNDLGTAACTGMTCASRNSIISEYAGSAVDASTGLKLQTLSLVTNIR